MTARSFVVIAALAGLTSAGAAAPGKLSAVQVSAAPDASCATTSTGEVYCWGDGDAGQLGNQLRERSRTIPAPVPGLTGVASVAANDAELCALERDGTVWCWGMAIGQTKGGRNDQDHWGLAPAPVPGLADIVQITVGNGRLLARRKDGAVLLWGTSFGVLETVKLKNRTGTRLKTQRETTPVEVPSLRGAVEVVEGTGRMPVGCARLEGGVVKCWSQTKYLGDGYGTDPITETPTVMPGLANALQLAIGADFGCALMRGGTVRCWGENTDGQLGDGTTKSRWTPAPVKEVSGAIAISVGNSFACAVLADRSARCWGEADVSLFADGSSRRVQATPRKLGVTGILELSIAISHACARVERPHEPSGVLVCWGTNQFAQLGDGTVDDRSTPSLVALAGVSGTPPPAVRAPAPAPTAALPVSIAAGADTSCAAYADGSVACWGGNQFGNLGNGTIEDRSRAAPADLANATAVTVGDSHACARLGDGTARCWGANFEGELGNGTSDNGSPIPTTVKLGGIAQISASSWTCALLTNGTVSCFGDEKAGPRGMGVSHAVEIATGNPHACARLSNGGVKCFGRNWTYAVSAATGTFRDTISIASSSGSCAVRRDGTVACWGTPNDPHIVRESGGASTIVTAPGFTNVTRLAMGQDIACAIRGDGSVICQQDDGPVTAVAGVAHAVAITAGRGHACALTEDGTILCWGANDHGQLGDGTTTDRAAAARVRWCP